MPDIFKLVLKYGIAFFIVYFVYRDSKKREIKHRNLWIIFSLLFPPTVIAYFLYVMLASKKVVLSKRQKVAIAIRKRAEEHRKKIAEERNALEKAKKEEEKKNELTLEELEQIKAERLAAKEKRLKELEEERRYQQEENIKKMGLSSYNVHDSQEHK